MARKVGSTKGAKAKADKYFSLIVRTKGFCENCGGINGRLECAHIISRRYSNTRCRITNAFCLDSKCHHYFTDHPVEFAKFVENSWASEYYTQNLKLANQIGKVDWHEIADDLKDIYDRIQENELTIEQAREYEV